MDESAMLRELILNDDSKILATIKSIVEDSYSNCLAERKEEYEKEIGEEKDGI